MSGNRKKKNRTSTQGTLLYMPAILIIFGIVVYPMLYALVMSFTGYSVRKPVMNFVGIANYITGCLILAGSGTVAYLYLWLTYTAGCIRAGHCHPFESSGPAF